MKYQKLIQILEDSIKELYVFDRELNLIYTSVKNANKDKLIEKHQKLLAAIKDSELPVDVNLQRKAGGMQFPNGDILLIGSIPKFKHEEASREKLKAIKTLLRLTHYVAYNLIEESNYIDNTQVEEFFEKLKQKNNKVNLNEFLPTDTPHNTVNYELKFLDAITEGDPDKALRALRSPMHGKEGRLGFTALRHNKNSVIINATVCARAALKAGVRAESAYTLADYYILSAEACKTEAEAMALREECTYRFAQFVKEHKSKNEKVYSNIVLKILNEIERNIFVKVTREDITSCVELNVDYVQRLFKSEVGHSIMDHLRLKRIESAKEILLNSEVKVGEIAALLHFASTSHFAKVFKELEGLSPLEYKAKHQSEIRI